MGTYYTVTQDKQQACALTHKFGTGIALLKCDLLNADTSDESAYFEYSSGSTVTGSGITSIDLHDYVVNIAGLPTGKDDGYKATVVTNGLTYEVIDGNYTIRDYCIDVPTASGFAALSQPVTRQKVYIEEIDKKYIYDGVAWHQIYQGGGSGGTTTVISSGTTITPVTGWSSVVDNADRTADSNDTQQAIGDTVATLVQDLITAGVLSP